MQRRDLGEVLPVRIELQQAAAGCHQQPVIAGDVGGRDGTRRNPFVRAPMFPLVAVKEVEADRSSRPVAAVGTFGERRHRRGWQAVRLAEGADRAA